MKFLTDSLYVPIGEFANHFSEFFEKLCTVHKISLPPLSLLLIYTSESEIVRKFFKKFLFYFNFFLDYVYYDGNIGHDGHEKSDRLILSVCIDCMYEGFVCEKGEQEKG